ncbi:xylose isomerase-like protein [Dendrothele bispora CBS 962.96]|uniref:Xylose isomerase-like protein n=1 Tax=Dendrothele bispora (strain CBS 962.96) TaxID=1314807 RepID=A0A4S8LUF0_DENBC|nr:xylose isomerase-like protein [Dendrothele bispora CBS 962.96]
MSDIAELPIVVASMSLGRAWVHPLSTKLFAAKQAGFKGIELFMEDLVYLAKDHLSEEEERDNDLESLGMNEQAMLQAAQTCKHLCDENGLFVLTLQPFMNYDGLLDEERHKKMIEKLELWFKVARVLGTNMIQVPSQMQAEGTTGDIDKLVADLTEIAQMGLRQDPPIRFGYEAIGWGAHVNLWEQSWDIVQRVNLPNFGLVLDTYHILSVLYGDPTSPTGILPTGLTNLNSSLSTLSSLGSSSSSSQLEEFLKKLFYIQLSDAELLDPPLSSTHELCTKNPGMNPLMIWSRNARLFPGEYSEKLSSPSPPSSSSSSSSSLPPESKSKSKSESESESEPESKPKSESELQYHEASSYTKRGGYLPVHEVAKVLFEDLGYRGVVSLESFSVTMVQEGEEVPGKHAEKGMRGWKRLVRDLEEGKRKGKEK